MILTGKLTLGEPCCPYTIEAYSTKDGSLVRESRDVYGRMIPLTEVRERLLKRQEKFMRLQNDADIDQMTAEEITTCLTDYGCNPSDHTPQTSLWQAFRKYQRQRSLVLWHDHATLLNRGFLMITVHTLYDKAVHLTDQEYHQRTGERVNVQAEVEQPEVHLLVLSSSAVHDQASTIGDRLEGLRDLAVPVVTSTGKYMCILEQVRKKRLLKC